MKPLTEIVGDTLRLNFHRGQMRAWESEKRFVALIAGTQSGKSTFGPHWLHREIKLRGPGDYLGVTPTFPLLRLKALPEFLTLFKRILKLGEYNTQERTFTFSTAGEKATFGRTYDVPTKVFFGYAADPDSLEAATGKAAWLDEAGQRKFRLGSWEAINRRLSVNQGRALVTTTPYDLGWLKQKLWDPWKAANENHPEIDVIRFDSTENPAFPQAEFDRARRELPRWKFDLFYRAIFTRPAGLIYDCFNDKTHKVPRFAIPESWPRFLGLDFGGVNTAGVFFAQEPATRRLFAYREYKAGGRTARDHCNALAKGEVKMPWCVGGSKSEGQWRDEFRAGGLPVREPEFSDVEVGIQRVYGAFATDNLFVFDDLAGLLEEVAGYSRETNDAGEVQEEIDNKEDYHLLDACRYILGWLRRPGSELTMPKPSPSQLNVAARAPAGVFGKR